LKVEIFIIHKDDLNGDLKCKIQIDDSLSGIHLTPAPIEIQNVQ
jgi:hypothetical protein